MLNKIIVALDNLPLGKTLELMRALEGKVWGFKLGSSFVELGPSIVCAASKYGNVMLDLKFYDIPSVVGNYCKVIGMSTDLQRVKIVTVHAHAGRPALEAASLELPGRIAAITVLTSFTAESYLQTTSCTRSLRDQVKTLALLAQSAHCSYVVGSGKELDILRGILPPIIPDVRPTYEAYNTDQCRVITPALAVKQGAHLLVIGRPITEAEDPILAVEKIQHEMV